jgi:oligosaccharide reducing-end xylanase
MAYILNPADNDVRTEGMSYGMMIAVQLNQREVFDRLWKWAKTYMYHETGMYAGFFAWQVSPNGQVMDPTAAPDGEEWFVTALLFASARWGDGEGIYNYSQEANALLAAMLNSNRPDYGAAMFHPDHHMVVFVPQDSDAGRFTNPSYHLPHFYQLWADHGAVQPAFWRTAVDVSRGFWQRTAHPVTGLVPNYAEFDGRPKVWDAYSEIFSADAWRFGWHVAVDYTWFAPSQWHVEQVNRQLSFFYAQGIGTYPSSYTIDGQPLEPYTHAHALVATNAAAASVSTLPYRDEFIHAFWALPVPSGEWRYYDGLLYMLSLLHLSGNYQIY